MFSALFHEAIQANDASLVLSSRGLQDDDFTREPVDFPQTLVTLDLSRNILRTVPSQLFHLSNLTTLDISRNSLRSLPVEIKNLTNLAELNALSNNFRIRLMPVEELASLSKLRLLDLRFNSKLKGAAKNTLMRALPSSVEVRCTIPDSKPPEGKGHVSACDRDPTDLRCQLEPLSTPQLRKRLERTFGVALKGKEGDSEEFMFDRKKIMERLLAAYSQFGPRAIRCERGVPLRKEMVQDLISEMEAIPWPQTTRERPKVKAEYYMILQKPGAGKASSAKTQVETAKLCKYRRIFDKAVQALEEVDPDFAHRFTAVAVTKNFSGSPHIDTLNVGPFYGLSLGNFTLGGGKIAVECAPTIVAEIDTRDRLAKVDGRFPHWVTPYSSGTRYSLIYYVTSGESQPQTTAIFPPPENTREEDEPAWVPPPTFVL